MEQHHQLRDARLVVNAGLEVVQYCAAPQPDWLLAAIDTGLCNKCHRATAIYIDFITNTSSPYLHQRRNYQSNKYCSFCPRHGLLRVI
jgi:hypothetical protein